MKSDFNAMLEKCIDPVTKLLDPKKILNLTGQEKNEMIGEIVENKWPLLIEFLTKSTDQSWLAENGYCYQAENKFGFIFLCPCANIPAEYIFSTN